MSNLQDQLVDQKRQVARLQGLVESLTGEVDSLKGDVDSLKGEVNSLRSLTGEVDSLKGDIDSLKGEVNSLRSQMRDVKALADGQVSGLKSQLAGIDREVSELRDQGAMGDLAVREELRREMEERAEDVRNTTELLRRQIRLGHADTGAGLKANRTTDFRREIMEFMREPLDCGKIKAAASPSSDGIYTINVPSSGFKLARLVRGLVV